MNKDCIFCKIVSGSAPTHTLYQDETTLAFLDIHPSTPGHTLVVLKRHGDTILEYTKEELGSLMVTSQKVARALEQSFDTKILTMGINHGEAAGVHHLHIHILPRAPGDGGGIIQSLVQVKSNQKLDTIRQEIRKYLK